MTLTAGAATAICRRFYMLLYGLESYLRAIYLYSRHNGVTRKMALRYAV
jgi:hypothetical protein